MINLKKAHKLQELLREAQHELKKPDNEVDAMTVTNWEAKADALLGEQHKKIIALIEIEEVIAEIRNAIATANAKVGITLILGEIRGLDHQIRLLDLAASYDIRDDKDVIEKRVELKKQELTKSDRFGMSSNAVNVSVFTQQWRDDMLKQLKQLKKRRRQLDDKLQEFNVSARIELSQPALDLLVKYELD